MFPLWCDPHMLELSSVATNLESWRQREQKSIIFTPPIGLTLKTKVYSTKELRLGPFSIRLHGLLCAMFKVLRWYYDYKTTGTLFRLAFHWYYVYVKEHIRVTFCEAVSSNIKWIKTKTKFIKDFLFVHRIQSQILWVLGQIKRPLVFRRHCGHLYSVIKVLHI